jgi:hypothetical protein
LGCCEMWRLYEIGASGISDWNIVLRRLHNLSPHLKVPRANPHVKDTVNAVRAILRTDGNARRLSIDPQCGRLIDDLRTAAWPGNLDLHHALAWLRYFVACEYPLEAPRIVTPGVVAFSKW